MLLTRYALICDDNCIDSGGGAVFQIAGQIFSVKTEMEDTIKLLLLRL